MLAVNRCLVTGADGFIGSRLCARLDKLGVKVLRATRSPHVGNGIVLDLEQNPLPSFKEFAPDVVFHLAARVHRFDGDSDAEGAHQRITVEGTNKLLMASLEAHVRRFVYFSSCAVMPAGVDHDLDESVEPHPNTPYGRAKLLAEQQVLSMNGARGLSTVCLRLPTVYGPGHKGQLARMIDAIERGSFPPITELNGARSFVHVEDVVDAAILVADSPQAAGKVYVVAEDSAYTSRQIYEIVLESLHRRSPVWRIPKFLLMAAAAIGDLSERMTKRQSPFDSDMLRKISEPARFSAARIENELGFRPMRTLRSSASELISARTP